MQIEFADTRPTGDYALVLPSADGKRPGAGSLGDLDKVEAALRRQRFDGEAGSAAEVFAGDGGTARRVLFVGTGGGAAADSAEKLGGTAVAKLLKSGEKHAVIDLSGLSYNADAAARVGLAASLRSWRYDRYHTRLKDKHKPTLERVTVVGGAGAADRWASRWQPVAEAVAFTRTLVTEPPNVVYPESFVELCRPLADLGIEMEVLDGEQMRELGMGALLGVAQGSVREPRMLILRWNGGADGAAPAAFVGKGVTFDTGGISIKPAQNMEAMKWDMAGAGGVVGAMMALAKRKAKANVVGICGLVENMPSGTAQRPGDVVTTMSGQTVEVINTDAEGRLVLADAITYVQRTCKPATIVDFATLTGAILVGLGHEFAGLFTPDDDLADKLMAASASSGDKLWRMPLAENFDRLIDSQIADVKNVGPREGGAITAAHFIKRFVDDGMKWAHIDMAGKAWSDKPSDTYDKGATGFGVRLIDAFVADNLER